MSVTHSQLIDCLKIEKFELGLMVVEQEEIFADVRIELIAKFGDKIFDLSWVYSQPPTFVTQLKTNLSKKIGEKLKSILKKLKQSICIDHDWCNLRDSPLMVRVEILAMILDAIGTSGAAALSVLIIKNEFLDKLCECNVNRE